MTGPTTEPSGGLILVADDDPEVRSVVGRWLGRAGYDVELFPDGVAVIDRLTQSLPDAVCLDLEMPGLDGIETLTRIKAKHRFLPVIMLTGDTSVESAVNAMREGAYDYLTKPVDTTHLIARIRNAVERYRMSVRLTQLEREADGGGFARLVGVSDAMKLLFRQMDRVAGSDITVLIQGESGTGKELVARAVHASSGRAAGPFVALNCAAIPETLQESELFGHDKGAFTGASHARAGRFEQANGGTLLLDEVAELSLPLQAKLLRVLQERRFHPLGGSDEIASDFRLIAATHRDLSAEVERGTFRQDLYFRVAVFELRVPSLSERREDIPRLVAHFLAELAGDDPPAFSRAAMERLVDYRWPGNVRELRNVVEAAFVLADDSVIAETELPPRLGSAEAPTDTSASGETSSAAPSVEPEEASRDAGEVPVLPLEELERRAIERAINDRDGNLSEACRRLGISRNTLYRKMKKHGLRSKRFVAHEGKAS